VRVLLQLSEPSSPGAIAAPQLQFELDGRPVTVPDLGESLLELLRRRLGVRSAKDGCAPQGQCGCCTVWVDGSPRVACVTPARRVAGRRVTTLEGLDESTRRRWADAFCATGASQCGFCTPGIIMRLAWVEGRGGFDEDAVSRALAAHLCRCTGWRTIVEAAALAMGSSATSPAALATGDRGLLAAAQRATLEGGTPQRVGTDVVLGAGGFADDDAPGDALVALPDARGGWSVGDSVADARRAAGRVPGRNSSVALGHPLELPKGDFALVLRTTFVEPAYLEPDASWCAPGGEPATPLANGGAFGGKLGSPVASVARRLANERRQPVRVLYTREDVVRLGPKRPPIAAAIRADGSGIVRVARTPGSGDLGSWRTALAAGFPGLVVEEVEVAGPPVSAQVRAAGWAEAAVLRAAWEATRDVGRHREQAVTVASPEGARASVALAPDGTVSVTVEAGEVLDEVVLRSYVVGAVHQGLGWVRSEGIAVGEDGEPVDLTIRSFGILPAREMPHVEVSVVDAGGSARRGGDAVFAATAAAAWLAAGLPEQWPLAGGG
jgi:aerobic-type carbon monoxide dehydrogenase small subunit (CoxS/CutS family)